MYTIEQGIRIGTAVATAAKTYGQASGLAVWSAKSQEFRPLEAAIGKACAIKDKIARKKALSIWSTTMKRVGDKGDKPAEGKPFLAFKVDGMQAKVYWKTPEASAVPAAASEGEKASEPASEAQKGAVSLADALARIQQAMSDEFERAEVEQVLASMLG